MMMPEAEAKRLDAAAAQVRIEARRVELTALIDRLRDHVERAGSTPGVASAIDKAQAELTALEQKGTPE